MTNPAYGAAFNRFEKPFVVVLQGKEGSKDLFNTDYEMLRGWLLRFGYGDKSTDFSEAAWSQAIDEVLKDLRGCFAFDEKPRRMKNPRKFIARELNQNSIEWFLGKDCFRLHLKKTEGPWVPNAAGSAPIETRDPDAAPKPTDRSGPPLDASVINNAARGTSDCARILKAAVAIDLLGWLDPPRPPYLLSCKSCARFFVNKNRRDQVTCSDKCRSNLSNRRRKE